MSLLNFTQNNTFLPWSLVNDTAIKPVRIKKEGRKMKGSKLECQLA